MGQGKIVGAAAASLFLFAVSSGAKGADATPLYQWSLNSSVNASAPSTTLVNPDVTPNGNGTFSAADGGTLTLGTASAAVGSTVGASAASVGTWTANGGGVSGASGDYALNNQLSAVHNNGGGGAFTTTANALTAMPNLTAFTITGWINPTTNAIAGGSGALNRIFNIASTNSYDGTAGVDGITIQMNGGAVEFVVNSQSAGSVSLSTSSGKGNSLVASQWQFVAVQVNLQSSNIYYDTGIRAATGGAESDNTAMYEYNATSNVGGYTYTGGFTSTGAVGNTSNGTILFGSDVGTGSLSSTSQTFATLLNNGAGSRALQGLGDDFRIYNSLLTTQNIQDIITADDPTASFATPEPSAVAGVIFISGGALLRRRRRTTRRSSLVS